MCTHYRGHIETAHRYVGKAWFFFDDVVVHLGANLSSTGPYVVTTSLAQQNLNGSVWYGATGSAMSQLPAETNMTLPEDTTWVWHGGVGYVLLDKATSKLQVSNLHQNGSWAAITQVACAEGYLAHL